MRYAQWTLMALILVFAASGAWAAQCGTACAQPVQVQCPTPCPTPCPVQEPCPQACACPCPASVPAAIGAGPAGDLQGLECPNFDPAYATKMYAQNGVIIAVTQYGMQRTHNGNLRGISGEINGYLTGANNKLQGWYGQMACTEATPDCGRAAAIIAELSATPDSCFDAVYAKTLSELLRQSNAADSIGGQQAMTPQMRQQAQFLAAKEDNWTMRLDRWVVDHP